MPVKTKKKYSRNGNNRADHSASRQLDRVHRYLGEGKYDRALSLLEKIYPKRRYDLHMNLLLGEVHLKIGQNREANKYFGRALDIEGDNFQALYGKGKTFYLDGNTEDAIRYLKRAAGNEDYQADVYNDLGTIFEELNEMDIAGDYYREAIRKNAQYVYPVVNLSRLLIKQEKPTEALSLINDFIENNGPEERLLINQGIIYEILNDYEKAARIFSTVLDRNPTYTDAYYNRAFCYFKLAMIEEARQDLESYLKIKADDEQVRGLLALSYTLEGKFVDSVDTWKEFLPNYQDLSKNISRAVAPDKIDPLQILEDFNTNGNDTSKNAPNLSVVIPVMDEEGSIIILYEKLKGVLEKLGQIYEIIFIDDGSTDRSLEILTDISANDETVSVIKFRRNYGQTAAFAAGFKYASGDVIITMDADLQNDPEDIPRLLAKMSEGYDLVSGWRKNRRDKTISRKIPSYIANRIINKLIAGSGVKVHDFGCSLKAYKKGIVKNIRLYGEMHRFIPAYAAWLGIKVAEIPVKHHPRRYGYAKYGLERVGRVVLDMITLRFFTGFRSRPLQFFGKVAAFGTIVGLLLSVLLFVMGNLTGWGIDFQTFLIMSMFSVLGGGQFIIVGVLSEIIMRGFLEAQDKDEYVVENILRSSPSNFT